MQIATRLSKAAATTPTDDLVDGEFIPLGQNGGEVRFLELDAEKMGEYFSPSNGTDDKAGEFDIVWITEALSHFPNKALFFHNAHQLLRRGGKLVLADWFKAETLGEGVFEADIKPIEGSSSPFLVIIICS